MASKTASVGLLVATLASSALLGSAQVCPDPDPVENFKFDNLIGRWHEIGKYQTFSPFELGCECTTLEYFYDDEGGMGVHNTCVQFGNVANVTGELVQRPGKLPGQLNQTITFAPGASSSAAYTIVEMGNDGTDDILLEFDCLINPLIGLSYCFHIFSKDPSYTMTPESEAYLRKFAVEFGLNPQNLDWQVTQTGPECPF